MSGDRVSIEVNGISLEEIQTKQEILDIHKEKTKDCKRLFYHDCKIKPKTETRKVSKRVRHYTHDEIRKEKGLMSHPYKTVVENIIYLIKHSGPITIKGINSTLSKTTAQTSSTINYIYQALKDEYIDRKLQPDEKTYAYFFKKDLAIETAHGIYKDFMKKDRAERKKRTTQTATSTKSVCSSTEPPATWLKGTIEETLSEQLGLNVTVSGEIKILFGFIKGGE